MLVPSQAVSGVKPTVVPLPGAEADNVLLTGVYNGVPETEQWCFGGGNSCPSGSILAAAAVDAATVATSTSPGQAVMRAAVFSGFEVDYQGAVLFHIDAIASAVAPAVAEVRWTPPSGATAGNIDVEWSGGSQLTGFHVKIPGGGAPAATLNGASVVGCANAAGYLVYPSASPCPP